MARSARGTADFAPCGVRIVGVEPVSRRRMGGSAANTIAAHRKVTIARAQLTLTFPASFVLIAAMNPCPCGFANDFRRECFCTPPQIQRYMSKISGPLMDRIDIQVDVPAVPYKDLAGGRNAESSETIRHRVVAA